MNDRHASSTRGFLATREECGVRDLFRGQHELGTLRRFRHGLGTGHTLQLCTAPCQGYVPVSMKRYTSHAKMPNEQKYSRASGRIKINLYCFPFGIEGYSIHSADLLRGLHASGVSVACRLPFSPCGRHPDPIIQTTIRAGFQQSLGCAGIKLDLAEAMRVATFTGSPRIFYTMTEVDRLPPSWVEALNNVDEVWTTCSWCQRVFLESGVVRPVRIVPEAVDTSLFTPTIGLSSEPHDRFRFLAVGKFEERKNYAALFRAYTDEFDVDEAVELIICFGREPTFKSNYFDSRFGANASKRHAPIRFLSPIMNRTAMANLYRSVDAFVLPTRGEGWGLPAMEAMASALPGITTGIGPMIEYSNNQTAFLLDYELVQAGDANCQTFHEYFKWGRWAEPSIAQLRRFMRRLFENPAEGRRMGLRAAAAVRENWGWEKAILRFSEALHRAGVDTK